MGVSGKSRITWYLALSLDSSLLNGRLPPEHSCTSATWVACGVALATLPAGGTGPLVPHSCRRRQCTPTLAHKSQNTYRRARPHGFLLSMSSAPSFSA